MKRIVKRIFLGAAVVITAGVIYLCNFTTTGYRMSAALHGFKKIDDCVYADQNWKGDTEDALKIIDSARERVTDFLVLLRVIRSFFYATLV